MQINKFFLDLQFGKTLMGQAGLSPVYTKCQPCTKTRSLEQGAPKILLLCSCLADKILPVMVRAGVGERYGQ